MDELLTQQAHAILTAVLVADESDASALTHETLMHAVGAASLLLSQAMETRHD
jgi:hypothetical protein